MLNFLLNIFNNIFFTEKNENFYYLSLIQSNNDWHIHGLWPQYSKDSYPTYCRTVDFDEYKLKPILNELKKYWYSEEEKNQYFWCHEWKKHGSCMFIDMDEFDYFNKTLELFQKVKDMEIIDKYKKGQKALIPFDLKFNLMKN